MKYILLSACLGFIFHSAEAQSGRKDSTRFYDHTSFGFGYQDQSFDALNSRITAYFPKSIPGQSFSFHYGGKSVFNQFLVQGDLSVGISTKGNRNDGRTTLAIFGLGIDGGIMLTRPGAVRIYPFAGLGIDVPLVNAKIRTGNISFDSVLANPATRASMEPVSFSNVFLSWRAGLGIDIGSKKDGNLPYTFGLKAGYKSSFHAGKWRVGDDAALLNAPSDRLEQWFASVVFYGPITKMKHGRR